MNRSYSKIRHIQEANQRLEKRVMSEQFNTTMRSDISMPTDSFDDTDFRSSNFNFDKYGLMSKKAQLEDIINNFESIDCEGIDDTSAESLYGQRPERDIIFCTSYKGKSKQDLIDLLNMM